MQHFSIVLEHSKHTHKCLQGLSSAYWRSTLHTWHLLCSLNFWRGGAGERGVAIGTAVTHYWACQVHVMGWSFLLAPGLLIIVLVFTMHSSSNSFRCLYSLLFWVSPSRWRCFPWIRKSCWVATLNSSSKGRKAHVCTFTHATNTHMHARMHAHTHTHARTHTLKANIKLLTY